MTVCISAHEVHSFPVCFPVQYRKAVPDRLSVFWFSLMVWFFEFTAEQLVPGAGIANGSKWEPGRFLMGSTAEGAERENRILTTEGTEDAEFFARRQETED